MISKEQNDYLIDIGLKTNIKEISKEFKDEELTKELTKLYDITNLFREALSKMDIDLKEVIKTSSDISDWSDTNNIINAIIENLERFHVQVKQSTDGTYEFIKALTGLGQQSSFISPDGKITRETRFSVPGKKMSGTKDLPQNEYYDLTLEEALNKQSLRSTTQVGIAGYDKTAKELLKSGLLTQLQKYGTISKEEQEKILNHMEDFVDKMTVYYDTDGQAVAEYVDFKLDAYKKYSQGIIIKDTTVDGKKIKFPERMLTSKFSYNEEKERQDILKAQEKERQDILKAEQQNEKEKISGIKKEINLISQLSKEKNNLEQSKYANEEINTIEELNRQIKTHIGALGELNKIGFDVDKNTGEIVKSQNAQANSVDTTTKEYKELLSEIDKYNSAIRKSTAQKADAEQSKQIDKYIKEQNELYDAERRLIELKGNRGTKANKLAIAQQELLIGQKKDLIKDTNRYSESVRKSTRATENQSKNDKKLLDYQNRLSDKVKQTAHGFDKLKESMKNTVLYGSLYKIFNKLENAVEDSIVKIRELDTAMTEIQMVTGQTDEEVHRVINSYADLGVQLGATTMQVAEGSIEWL